MPIIDQKLRYENGKPNLIIARVEKRIKDIKSEYNASYLDFCRLASKKFNVYYANKYLGQGVFKNGFKFHKNRFKEYPRKIFSKIIFNKRRLKANGGKDWQVINKIRLYRITFNKYCSYKIFKKYMKPTYRIKNRQDFNKKIKKIRTKKAVFKPMRGAGGVGIIIAPANSIAKKIKRFDGLLQEFINTSQGIIGLCHSIHDMRILIMNGKIIQTYIRMPKKGSLLSNIARGGSMKEIKKSKVPLIVKKIAFEIDKKYFKKFGPRIYSIDFGFENGRPYIFEMNSQPGLPFKAWRMYYNIWHKELLKTLLSAIK